MTIKRIRCFYLALLFGFFLGIHEGYISLWHGNEANPLQIFPYRAEMLPKADFQALENGIYLKDQQQLQQLLEDYLS